jgi:minor extracellular serine protease Vpr
MRRLTTVLVVSMVVLFALVGGALAGKPSGDKRTQAPRHDFTEVRTAQTQSDYYVVTFKEPPAASYEGGISGLQRTKPERGQKLNPNGRAVRVYKDFLKSVHDDYRGWMAANASTAAVVDEYFLSGNALAVKANGVAPDKLGQGPGVRHVTASALYTPTMNISTGLIDADALWPLVGGQSGAGAGIKVGVIDTGIVETHEFFACKDAIVHKVYASGVAGTGQTIVFDHGTHVAGTVAGCVTEPSTGVITDTVSGVAPAAELWDYNIFPGFGGGFIAFGGSAFSHDIAEALEDTVEDGMDVVNMSIGGMVQGPHDLLAEAVDATNDAGVVVAVAAGNSGPGDSTIESPGSALGALTAGASTNPHFIGIPATGTKAGGGSFSHGAALGDFNNFVPAITAAYTVTTPANGCTAITTNVSGKIALIDRGVCTFTTKIRNAQNAGAAGVLVVNNVAGDPTAMAHDGTSPFPTIPAAMLGRDAGNTIKPSGTVTVDGSSPKEFVTTNADIIAGFSSRGPTPFTYLIKPDVAGPGVNVYSSVFNNQYAMFQGTSMATPHVAGSAALLLQLHSDWSPEDVKSALVTQAKRPVFHHVTGTTDAGILARGGGRIDLDNANQATVLADPASVSFGKFTGNVAANGSVAVVLRSATGSSQLCSASVTGPPKVTLSSTAFSVPGTGTTTLTVSFNGGTASQTPSGDYTGDVVLTCGGVQHKSPWWTRVDREGKP